MAADPRPALPEPDDLPTRLAAARGDRPADLVFRGGRVVNVFTGEVEEEDVAVVGSRIVGVGSGYEGAEAVELDGRYLLPGFLDAHVHIESSLVTPAQFARAVLPRGTTTVVSDPHEIANVHGLEGIRYMLDASEGLPLDVRIQASSCVPATPMGTAGARLGPADLAALLDHPRVLGLAEVMNFPGAIRGEPEILEKIRAFRGRPVDGHAPGVTGKPLNAYVTAGPASDHESTTAAEALEKLRRGLHVFFREATNARNLRDLLPALSRSNAARVALCTDDRQPPDLLDEGGIDACVRICIEEGVDPVEAIRLATLNPAGYFSLHDRGAIGPGRRADLVVVTELESLEVERVFAGGREVAAGGRCHPFPDAGAEPPVPSMHVDPAGLSLRIPARNGPVRVIVARPNQLVTGSEVAEPRVRNGEVVADPDRDLLKLAVVERHGRGGGTGLGIVRGLGLRTGAIGSTVAHDHHNLIVAGADDASMEAVIRRLVELKGGLAAARDGSVTAELPLPVGGLMSPDPVEDVRRRFDAAVAGARALGSELHDPFMALSFLGLEVIPRLKLTDQGLVDVEAFRRVSLWAGTASDP